MSVPNGCSADGADAPRERFCASYPNGASSGANAHARAAKTANAAHARAGLSSSSGASARRAGGIARIFFPSGAVICRTPALFSG